MIRYECRWSIQGLFVRLRAPFVFTPTTLMPPKSTTSPPLNDAEKMLMVVAARIVAATKYREDHPDQMDPNFGINLSSEAVRRKFSFMICCLIIFRDMSLKSIRGFHFQKDTSTVPILPSPPLRLRPNCQQGKAAK